MVFLLHWNRLNHGLPAKHETENLGFLWQNITEVDGYILHGD